MRKFHLMMPNKYVLPRHTFPSVLEPGVRTVRAILTQLDPFLAHCAENSVRFDFAYQGISTKGLCTMFSVASARVVDRGIIHRTEGIESGRRRVRFLRLLH